MKALRLNCVVLPSKFYKPPWSFFPYRCPQYEGGSQCLMVPDPQDPECCKVPQCPQGNTVPPVIIGTQSPTPAQTTPFKIVINPNGPIIFGTPEPSTPVPRRSSTNWGEKIICYFISLLNSTMIGLEIWLWACEVKHASVEKMFLLYGIIALLINFIGGGGVLLKSWMQSCVL